MWSFASPTVYRRHMKRKHKFIIEAPRTGRPGIPETLRKSNAQSAMACRARKAEREKYALGVRERACQNDQWAAKTRIRDGEIGGRLWKKGRASGYPTLRADRPALQKARYQAEGEEHLQLNYLNTYLFKIYTSIPLSLLSLHLILRNVKPT